MQTSTASNDGCHANKDHHTQDLVASPRLIACRHAYCHAVVDEVLWKPILPSSIAEFSCVAGQRDGRTGSCNMHTGSTVRMLPSKEGRFDK
jgi:hypothetical protein